MLPRAEQSEEKSIHVQYRQSLVLNIFCLKSGHFTGSELTRVTDRPHCIIEHKGVGIRMLQSITEKHRQMVPDLLPPRVQGDYGRKFSRSQGQGDMRSRQPVW